MSVKEAKGMLLSTISTLYNIPVLFGLNKINASKCEIYISRSTIRPFYNNNCERISFLIEGTLNISSTQPCNKEVGFFLTKAPVVENVSGRFNLTGEETLTNNFINMNFEYLSKEYDNLIGKQYNINDLEVEINQP